MEVAMSKEIWKLREQLGQNSDRALNIQKPLENQVDPVVSKIFTATLSFGKEKRELLSIVESGQIHHEDYKDNEDLSWHINSDCESVTVESVSFDLEDGHDFLVVGENSYTGPQTIYQIAPQNFTITFTSDGWISRSGFVLYWYCTTHGKHSPSLSTSEHKHVF